MFDVFAVRCYVIKSEMLGARIKVTEPNDPSPSQFLGIAIVESQPTSKSASEATVVANARSGKTDNSAAAGIAGPKSPKPELFSEKDKISILLHEYDTLRQEILARTNHGWQLIAVGAALFVWLIQAKPDSNFWVGFVAVVLAILLGAWTTFGNIAKVAKRVEELEREINFRAGEELLVWEMRHGGGLTGFVRRLRPGPSNITTSSDNNESSSERQLSGQLTDDKNDRKKI
ncbi:MAG: hypothetical protein ABSG78_12205 [Verrucomicrobiota bacterium]